MQKHRQQSHKYLYAVLVTEEYSEVASKLGPGFFTQVQFLGSVK